LKSIKTEEYLNKIRYQKIGLLQLKKWKLLKIEEYVNKVCYQQIGLITKIKLMRVTRYRRMTQ